VSLAVALANTPTVGRLLSTIPMASYPTSGPRSLLKKGQIVSAPFCFRPGFPLYHERQIQGLSMNFKISFYFISSTTKKIKVGLLLPIWTVSKTYCTCVGNKNN